MCTFTFAGSPMRTFERLRTGALTWLDTPAPVLAFVRGAGQDAVLCVFNLSNEPVGWPLPEGWTEAGDAPGTPLAAAGLPPFGFAFCRTSREPGAGLKDTTGTGR